MMDSRKPVVRIAPSPTGNLHVGTARAALFNFLYARQNGGTFLLRIEDTDKERSTQEFEKNILDGLSWLGLSWDEMYRQSERTSIYEGELNKLIENGSVYVSQEKQEKEGDRAEVIRFKNPNKRVTFHDEIRGEVSFDTTELGDFVIAKSKTEPLYHFAVVVDDFLSGVTHVIRGEDHISNTPRQILIQEAMGAPRPVYAHLPLILGPDRSKLSKRHGTVSLTEYKERGFLPEAMLNFLALLGFNPGTDQEIFTLDELVKIFDISRVQKGGAIFDEKKLSWMNKEYLKIKGEEFTNEYIANAILSSSHAKELDVKEEDLRKTGFLFSERISLAQELRDEFERGEWDYLFQKPICEPSMLIWKKPARTTDTVQSGGDDTAKTVENMNTIISVIENLDASVWEKTSLKTALDTEAQKIGPGSFFWPLRVALSGKERSPDPVSLMIYFGKQETLTRLKEALSLLQK